MPVSDADRRLEPISDPTKNPLLTRLVSMLRQSGVACFLVGGTVRDILISSEWGADQGIEPVPTFPPLVEKPSSPKADLDFAVPSGGLHIARQLADSLGAAYYPLDSERDVGRIVLEVSPGGGRYVVDISSFQGGTLESDLDRRDFAINAMAVEVTRHPLTLIDPQHGCEDLLAKRLRAVSSRAISDDPVRTLRAVRFQAQLGFVVDAYTESLIRSAAPTLKTVSRERVRDELVKILSLPGLARSIRLMDEWGILEPAIPGLSYLKELPQSPPHRWDVFTHTIETVSALESLFPLDGSRVNGDLPFPGILAEYLAERLPGAYPRRLLLTFSGLLHDLGKPDTMKQEAQEGHISVLGYETVGAPMAASVMRNLRFSRQAVQLVETTVRYHLRPLHLCGCGTVTNRAIHRYYRDAGQAGVDVVLLALADFLGTVGSEGTGGEWSILLDTSGKLLDAYFNRRQEIVFPPPLLTGEYVVDDLGLSPGPQVGTLLAGLAEAQASGDVTTQAQAKLWIRMQLNYPSGEDT